MCMDNKNIGSCRCAACNKLLTEEEYVLCEECNEKSITEEELIQYIENI